MAELLIDDDIERGLTEVDGWRRDGDAIVRDLDFADFATAMAFVNRVADLAQQRDHHPDILVHGWNKVRLTVSNHSAGGLTSSDFELASGVDKLLADR
jgi:4a-hydroxytetrahydrobiopterin dehydratase